MKLEQIRSELLGEHESLRATMTGLRALLARAARGEPVAEPLRRGLALLQEQLRTHNLHEEELLRDVVPSVDAWGPARAEIMTEEHVAEHEALRATLARTSVSPEQSGPELEHMFDHMLAHMKREEEAFLGEDVLRDDAIVVEIGG